MFQSLGLAAGWWLGFIVGSPKSYVQNIIIIILEVSGDSILLFSRYSRYKPVHLPVAAVQPEVAVLLCRLLFAVFPVSMCRTPHSWVLAMILGVKQLITG
jgi:hypothetical protein